MHRILEGILHSAVASVRGNRQDRTDKRRHARTHSREGPGASPTAREIIHSSFLSPA